MNDLISRDNLSKYKEKLGCNEPVEVDAYYGGWNNAIDYIIENEPPAEPKKGRWVGANEYAKHLTDETGEVYTVSSMGTDRLFCNQCWKPGGKLKSNYCPNCGAKMEVME